MSCMIFLMLFILVLGEGFIFSMFLRSSAKPVILHSDGHVAGIAYGKCGDFGAIKKLQSLSVMQIVLTFIDVHSWFFCPWFQLKS